LRSPFLYGSIAILIILALASPLQVLAQKNMLLQASFNPTQTDRGVSVNIIGRVSGDAKVFKKVPPGAKVRLERGKE
jgi:hypothetical protein